MLDCLPCLDRLAAKVLHASRPSRWRVEQVGDVVHDLLNDLPVLLDPNIGEIRVLSVGNPVPVSDD
jgi:hypothetical protein